MAAPYDPEGADLAAACVALSTDVCEAALSHLGNLATISLTAGTNAESVSCIRFYPTAVEECLRKWDWPFATRYAVLAAVVGDEATPINGDWRYAFRLPDDCLKVRRIVDRALGRLATSTPAPFRSGTEATREVVHPAIAAFSDLVSYQIGDVASSAGVFYRCIKASRGFAVANVTYWVAVTAWSAVTNYAIGDLASTAGVVYVCIAPHLNRAQPNATYWTVATPGWTSTIADPRRVVYTNERDGDSTDDAPTLEIEYTYRPDCAALVGDQLFKNALAWLVASKIALPVTRSEADVAKCFGMYLAAVALAETIGAQEKQDETGSRGEADAVWTEAR